MSRSVRPKRVATGVAVLATAALALAACTPGSNTASDQTTAGRSPSEVVTDISKVGDQTLTVWDQEVRGGQNEQMERLNAAFEEKYPNITIKRVKQSTDDLNTTLRLALTGNDAPDVTQANNSRSQMGQYVAAGQLVSLDPYADAYGWKDRFSPSVLQYTSFSPDGKTWGEGSVYALPQVGEIVGVFYSKSKLAQLGLEVPQTWADFEGQLRRSRTPGRPRCCSATSSSGRRCTCSGPSRARPCRPTRSAPSASETRGRAGRRRRTSRRRRRSRTGPRRATSTTASTAPTTTPPGSRCTKGKGVYLMGGSWLAADLRPRWATTSASSRRRRPRPAQGPVTTGGHRHPVRRHLQGQGPRTSPPPTSTSSPATTPWPCSPTPATCPWSRPPRTPRLRRAGGRLHRPTATVTETGNAAAVPRLRHADHRRHPRGALQGLMTGDLTPKQFTETVEEDYAEFVASNGDGAGRGAAVARRHAGRRPPAPRAYGLTPYLFLLPAFARLRAFLLYPLGGAIQISLYDWDGLTLATFVGFGNYADLFGDERLRAAFGHAFVLIVLLRHPAARPRADHGGDPHPATRARAWPSSARSCSCRR